MTATRKTPARWTASAAVLAALLATAGAAHAAPINVQSATDVINSETQANCPRPVGAFCIITKTYAIKDGSTLDFGTRDVTLASSGTLSVVATTATILGASFTMAPGSTIDGRGDQAAPKDKGGTIIIQVTGNVAIKTNPSLAHIDVSGDTAAGIIRIFAGGNIQVEGKLLVNGTSPVASAGVILLDAGGDVTTLAGSIITGTSSQSGGGNIDIEAGGRAVLGDTIDMSGGDGGTVTVTSGADATLRRINVNSNADSGSGGSVDVLAGTSLAALDLISVDGTNDGCGGDIDVESQFGDVHVAVGLSADGFSPDGDGGTVSVTAKGNAVLDPASMLTARGGTQSCGGDVSVDSRHALTASGTIDSGGGDAGSIELSADGPVTVSGTLLAVANGAAGAGGDIFIDAGQLTSGSLTINGIVDVSGDTCDQVNGCGFGGLISFDACDLTISSGASLNARGGNGGTIQLSSREHMTVNGTVRSQHTSGAGTAGLMTFIHPTRTAVTIAQSAIVDPLAVDKAEPTCAGPADDPLTCLRACPTCGDGIVTFPETCDTTGTPVSCDGCSTFCLVENCNDDNPCTTDSCDPILGCRHQILPNGTSCSDGLVCTGTEACLNGICTTTPLVCDDKDPCTIDTCTEPDGCHHAIAPENSPCDDGDKCTVGDFCTAAHVCQPGTPRVCDDGNECTLDACDTLHGNPITGCLFTFRSGGCTDDGNLCTNDTCSAGKCTHPAKNCNDNDSCTTDACDAATGTCTHTLTPACTPTTTSSTTTSTTTSSSTTAPLCGNGHVDPGEQCDGTDLGGATCPGSAGGAFPTCAADCTLDFGPCPVQPTTTTSTSVSTTSTTSTSSSVTTTSSTTTSFVATTVTSTSIVSTTIATTSSTSTSTTSSTSSSTSTPTSSTSTSTSTTSTSTSSSSTSSTVPPCVPSQCDDGEPCTRDDCANNACRHTDRTGIASVTCAFEASGLRTPLCAGETVPGSIAKKLNAAAKAANKATGATDVKKAKKTVKTSAATLRALQKTITRLRKKKLSPACGTELSGAVDDALVRLNRWLDNPTLDASVP